MSLNFHSESVKDVLGALKAEHNEADITHGPALPIERRALIPLFWVIELQCPTPRPRHLSCSRNLFLLYLWEKKSLQTLRYWDRGLFLHCDWWHKACHTFSRFLLYRQKACDSDQNAFRHHLDPPESKLARGQFLKPLANELTSAGKVWECLLSFFKKVASVLAGQNLQRV